MRRPDYAPHLALPGTPTPAAPTATAVASFAFGQSPAGAHRAAGSWNLISHRNRKEGFAETGGRGARPIAPTTRGWRRAFGPGAGPAPTIDPSDLDGVGLSAVRAPER